MQEGLLTPAELRSKRFARVVRGVYRPAWVPLTHELACHAAMMVSPQTARATGRTLATLQGARLVRPWEPVEVVVPRDDAFGQYAGLRVRSVARGPLGDRTFRGIRVVDPMRMAFDLAARWPLETAVSHLDAAAHHGLVDLAAFAGWLKDRHDNDVVGVRAAAALADHRAESLPESVCRVRLVLAGIDVEPQVDVQDRSGFVLRADLVVRDLKIAIQYQGGWHALVEQQQKDAEMQKRLREAGWIYIPVTADMLRDRFALVATVRAAIDEARVVLALRRRA